ncbi:sigma-54-dependent Fis family transcriptional regulator [Pseudonocardia sediminis]|uniref:sigma-54-dependent Fis family transcriptional regulator n=1 Tax=Pseudonocardia sediminis TaxID=1397368 RepID=UPI00102999AD|nr:helix-turn-helix domain-containing protein [Pseudonocardia sediminis]
MLRAAAAVVDRLAGRLDGEPLAIVVADAEARVLARRVGRVDVADWLDGLRIVPGALLSEEAIGTNAIGCAVQERRSFAVVGAEHYRDNLWRLSARAVPIRQPVTGVLKGALTLACRTEDDSVLLLPLVEAAAARIEAQLVDDSTRRERLLLERFVQVTRRTTTAVVCLNRDLLLSNTLACPLVGPADQPVLWDWAARVLAGRDEYCGELRLADGTVVRARCTQVRDDEREAGIVIEMSARLVAVAPVAPAPPAGSAPARGACGTGGAVAGRGAAAERIRRELASVAETRRPVLISGETGTGKSFLARHLHQHDGRDGPLTVLDTGQCPDDPRTWFEALRTGLAGPGTLVLRHIDALPPELAARAVSMVEQADEQAARVIATARLIEGDAVAGPIAAGAAARLRDCFAARLHVPPLRRRIEDIADVARALVGDLTDRTPAPRLEPATQQTLMGQLWPGNVRELRAVLGSALIRSRGRDVAIKHLPPEYRTAPIRHRLTSLQRAEREAVLNALDDCRGNKQAAAEQLGIARSTLYRKIRILGVDSRSLSG